MKIGNFGSFDDTLKKQGIVGLTNASRLDKQIWNEFNGRWDELAFESERLIALRLGKDIEAEQEESSIPLGAVREVTVKQRVNQSFFRKAVLTAYNSACCITGLNNSPLLIASHIKPWAASNDKEKVDPYNGYLLTPLYDKLFDRGFITFTFDRHMIISEAISNYNWKLLNIKNDTFIQELPIDDKRIEYLKFHHDNVYKGHFNQ